MENNQFSDPSSGVPKPIGTGEGESPLQNIPMQNITMQTMESDIKSMKENGGTQPTPYIPNTNTQPAMGGNNAFIPQQMNNDQFLNQQPPTPSKEQFQESTLPPEQPKKSSRGLFVGIITFLVVVGFGLAGYFFVYPYFVNPSSDGQEQTPVASEQPAVIPQESIAPQEPAVSTPTSTPTSTETSAPVELIHKSLFKNPADITSEISLASLSFGSYSSSIENATADVSLFKEIVFRNDGKVISFSDLMSIIAPKTFLDVATEFNPDATFFAYTNSDGTWPGVIAKIKTGAQIDGIKTKMAAFETSEEFKNFFLSDPGTAKGWNNGKIGTFISRYNSFSKKGASFNYVWANDTLVISTNYSGIQEALKRLGL